MNKFWKWAKDEVSSNGSELIIDGVIASESWWGDEVTPAEFRSELANHSGPISVRINSPGGDVFAGVAIYNALRDHAGEVTVKVDGLAASIASVIAMAGDEIVMLPGAMMMVHQPWSIAMGNADELAEAAAELEKICEGTLVPIYAARTGKSEDEIRALLKSGDTWMTAEEAVEMGFATKAESAKTPSTSASVKNIMNFASAIKEAVMQPAMALQAKVKAEEEEVQHADDTPQPVEETVEPPVEIAADPKPEEQVTNNNEEPIMEENPTNKTNTEQIAQDQVIAPQSQAAVDTKAKPTDFLKSNDSVEAFAQVLKDNAGRNIKEVRAAWKAVLVKNGLTDADYFVLPDPLVSSIEDAVKASGIYAALNHTGLDVFRVDWDDTDAETDTSRAGGHKKGDTKDEQILDFDKRVIRAQYIYKYLVLDKETVRENRSSGALIRFVLNELPTRIIREMERAAIIGDGRASDNKRKISEFISVKADVEADNVFATAYVPEAGESLYESVIRAKSMVKADGGIYLVAKDGYMTDVALEKDTDGRFLFQPGSDMAAMLRVAGVFEPEWFTDATDPDYDAYLVVLGGYKTVGDNSIEAFTNFKLETNENEYLQEIYKGGALSLRKAAVGIAKVVES